jgi:ABC-2 type transport system ATP-binding protein
VIEIRDLFKYYGDRRAIGPLSASIQKGEIVGLLGLNGAGKTTTLRVLACDLLPTSGTVSVGGIDVVETPHAVRERIGYLPDTPPVYPEMTVDEYLRFAGKLRGLGGPDLQKAVDDVVDLTEIDEERDRPIGALSHGYRQRVGIAQAIVHRPELVVLDEPISGLDPVQIVEMRALVRSLGGDHTVVVSSHILQEISETCDRILVIRDGEIVASGTEKELSRELLSGMRITLTLRVANEGRARAEALLTGVAGVLRVEAAETGDPSPEAASYRIHTDKDVRDELCRAVVNGGFGLLELTRGERELESVFLELAKTTNVDPERRLRKRRRRKAEPEPAPEAKPEPAANDEEES